MQRNISIFSFFLQVSKSQLFVRIWIIIVTIYNIIKTCRSKLKSGYSFAKIVLTFHYLNDLFLNDLNLFFQILNLFHGVLLPILFWPTVENNCSSDWEKLLKLDAEGREFAKNFEIAWISYSNSNCW